MIKALLNSKTKTVAQGAIIIAVSQLISRFLGLLRDGLFARAFSTTDQAGIYFAAFKIPDFVFNFLVAGGLSVIFLPVFAQYWHKEGKEKAWEMANYVINAIFVMLSLFSLVCFIFASQLMRTFVPGLSESQLALAVPLTRLLLLSPIFMGLSSLFSSALMHFDHFVSYSLAPILYNLSIIGGIVFLAPRFGIMGVGYGVIVGAFLHFAIQIPTAVHNGYKFQPVLDFNFPALRKIYRIGLPRIIAASSQQLDDLLTTGIVSVVVSVSAISVLAYAYNLHYIPVGLFALPFAISAFPTLSRQWEAGEKEKFFESFDNTLRQILFFSIPLATLLFLLRAQVVRLLYESLGNFGRAGNFGKEAVILTAACLGVYALTTFFTSVIPLLIRGFFAAKNTLVPTIISIISIAIDIAFSWIFPVLIKGNPFFAQMVAGALDLEVVKDFSVVGVPLALLLSSGIQAILLSAFFVKKYGDFGLLKTAKSAVKMCFCSLLAGGICYGILLLYPEASIFPFAARNPVIFLFIKTLVAGSLGVGMYLFFCYVFKVEEMEKSLKAFLGKL